MDLHIIAVVTAIALTFLPADDKTSAQKPKPEPQEKKVVTHVVRKGETLATIANIYYKDTDYWTNIWNDNSWIKDANLIEKDWKIEIESKRTPKPEALSKELQAKIASRTIAKISPGVPLSSPQTPPSTQTQPKTTSYDQIYQEAGAKYGVPWEVLYGLHLTETGQRDGEIYNKSGSGAQGPMQFMPGTWRAYGVDGNGDGSADINNAVDAIHGAANYLQKHGSLAQGLRSYGGNTPGTLNAAVSRGYTP